MKPTILREIGFDQKLGDTVPLDTPFRDETGKAVRLARLLRGRQAGGAEPRLLRLPDALHRDPLRHGQRPQGAALRRGQGVRGGHHQLRPQGGPRAGGGQEGPVHGPLPAARGREGLALPHRGAGRHPPHHQGRGLPLRVGPGQPPVRPSRGHGRPHLRGQDRPLPLRGRVRAARPAPGHRRGLGQPHRLPGGRGPAGLLPVRSLGGPLQRLHHEDRPPGRPPHRGPPRRLRPRQPPAGTRARGPAPGRLQPMHSDIPLFPQAASTMADPRGPLLPLHVGGDPGLQPRHHRGDDLLRGEV